jgi:hypothetical protein
MRRLEIGEKIGCAALVVAVTSAIATWLSVPGVLQPRIVSSATRAPVNTTRTTAESSNGQPITGPPATIKPPPSQPPTSTSPRSRLDQPKAAAPIDLNAVLSTFRPFYTPPRPAPVHKAGLLYEFRFCTYDKKLEALYCYAYVTNEGNFNKSVTLNCGTNTVVVDKSGKSFWSSRCYLGGDNGVSWASDTLVPGVKYKLSAIFDVTNFDNERLQYLGFGIDEGVGFKDIPIDPFR